jgi:hypothetical protein
MIRVSSLSALQAWLDTQNKDPAITLALLQGLHEWRGHHSHPPSLQLAQLSVDQQNDIGWSLLLEGWLATEWAQAQQEYYSLIRSKKLGRTWAQQLIGKLLEIAKALWTHQNETLHKQANEVTKSMERKINQEIPPLYRKASRYLKPSVDR